jgi:hypothetical protein
MKVSVFRIFSWALLILCAGFNQVASAEQPPARFASPEGILDSVKIGVPCSGVRKAILAQRLRDIYFWRDGFRAGIDRFQIRPGVYALLKYNTVPDGLNTLPTDMLIAKVWARFEDLRPQIRHQLFAHVRLIHESPSLNGLGFDPVSLIRCANGLRRLGKDLAIESLLEYVALCESASNDDEVRFRYDLDVERVFLICRVLFVPRNKKIDFPDMYWAALTYNRRPIRGLPPLFPIVMMNDIPFDLSFGRAGQIARSPKIDVEFCKKNCELRESDFAPNASPQTAARAIADSKQLDKMLSAYEDDEAKSILLLLQMQAVRSLENVIGLDHEFFMPSAPDSIWKSYLADEKVKSSKWNAARQEFSQPN